MTNDIKEWHAYLNVFFFSKPMLKKLLHNKKGDLGCFQNKTNTTQQ